MKEAYIIDGIRTPIGSFGGSLSPVRADDLAALVIRELVARNPQIPVEVIGDVILGCHNQAGEEIEMWLGWRCCWRACLIRFREKQ